MSDLFYRTVTQVVLMFGLDSWALLDAMMRAMEGNHMGFLRWITGKQARHQADGTWEKPAAEEFLRTPGTKSTDKYIGR